METASFLNSFNWHSEKYSENVVLIWNENHSSDEIKEPLSTNNIGGYFVQTTGKREHVLLDKV